MRKLIYLVIILSFLYSCKKDDEKTKIPHSSFSQKILDGYFVYSIAFDNLGNTWIGTFKQGLIKYNYNETIIYNSTNSIISDSSIINDIAVDSENNVWIGTTDKGLIKYDGNNFTQYNSSNSPVPTDNVFSIAIDSKDNIWFSSFFGVLGGMVMYDGADWNVYTTDNSVLPDSRVHSIAIDKNDIVWLALTRELVKIFETNWIVYNSDDFGFTPYHIIDIQTNSKNQVCGSISYALSGNWYHKGPDLFIFDGMLIDTLDYGSEYDMKSLMIDNLDNIWCLFYEGHYAIYTGKNWIDGSSLGESLFAIEQAKDDKIWLGTGNGVYISN